MPVYTFRPSDTTTTNPATGCPSQIRATTLQAFRFETFKPCIAFKEQFFSTNPSAICPISGLPINPENSEIDHQDPTTFLAIVCSFCLLYKLDLYDPSLTTTFTSPKTNKTYHVLTEPWASRFRAYHINHAELRMVEKTHHRKQSYRSVKSLQEDVERLLPQSLKENQ